MTARPLTRSVGVLGAGIAGFAAAVAFRRALPDAQVTLFGGDGAAAQPEYVGAAAPYIHRFHRLVGIYPDLFRLRTGAVTASEVEIGRAGKPSFRLVPLGEMPYVDGAALHQLWLRRTASDPAAGPAWADVARRARRQEDIAEGLGVRFSAGAYLALLGELAALAGVTVTREVASAEQLADSLDLVIDTCGPGDQTDWLRVGGIPGSLRWSVHRPAAGVEPVERLEIAETQVSWDNAAWRAEGRVEADGAAGRVKAPWKGKVLAVGRAAVRCETFDGQPLAVALSGIARAIELLPRPDASGQEAAEYNRRTSAVHDFLLDWAAERWGIEGEAPAGLAALRGQFLHRGRIPFRDEDPVPPAQWLGWLLGSGERPRNLDLTAMAVPNERLAAIFARV